MLKKIWRAKFAANLFFILFIVQSVASIIESDVSGRIGNATASLRLTRQKVLIQEVQSSENSRGNRTTKKKYGIGNQDDNALPDIIVEQLRIRAEINFPTSRACKNLLTDFLKDKTSRIGFSNSRDRKLIYCYAELLKNVSKNEKRFESENSTKAENIDLHFYNKKFIYNDTEIINVASGEFDGKSSEKLNNSFAIRKNEEKRKIGSNEIFLQNGFSQFHATSELKKDNNSSKKQQSEYSETKNEEIGQEELNFKPKKLNIFDNFHENKIKNSTLNENSKFRIIKSSKNEKEINNTRGLLFADDKKNFEKKNNKLELSAFNSKKKLNKRSVNTKILQPCREKPKTISVMDYSAALQLNNREEKIGDDRFSALQNFNEKSDDEKIGFHRREKRSLKVSDNSTRVSINQKKVPKKTGKSVNIKKPKSENLTKKSQNEIAKSSVRKSRNLTKEKIKLEKQSNNAMSDFMATYASFFTTFLKSIIDAGSAIKNKNVSTSIQKSNERKKVALISKETPPKNVSVMNNSTINDRNFFPTFKEMHFPNSTGINFSNVTKNGFPNFTEIHFPNSTGINLLNLTKNGFVNFTEMNSLNSTENNFPTPTEINFPNSAENNFPSLTENKFITSTEINFPNLKTNDFYNFTEFDIPKLAEIYLLNSTSSTFTISPQRKLVIKKAGNYPQIYFANKFQETKAKALNLTDSLESVIESENVFNNSKSNYQTIELSSDIEKNIADTLNADTKNNEEKKSELEMSVIKLPTNTTENLTTISNQVTSENRDDFYDKEDSILLNSLPNNSANIAQTISTYPTLKRYSRNDTLQETVSLKPTIINAQNNDTKNRQSKNSLGDFNSLNIVRKSHGNRGRKRSRYKGKMQQPFIGNSLPRVGKQSWRNRNNASAMSIPSVTSISTTPTAISTLPSEIIDSSNLGENRRSILLTILKKMTESTLPTILEKVPESTLPTNLDKSSESSLSTVSVPTELRDAAKKSIVSDNVIKVSDKVEFNISAASEVLKNEILHQIDSTPTFNEFSRSKKFGSSTDSLKFDKTIAINDFSKKAFTEFSTIPYDNFISLDPVEIRKSDNSIISNKPEVNLNRNLGKTEIEQISEIEITESSPILGSSATLKMFFPVESKSKHEQVIINTVNDDFSIFSTDESKVPSIPNRIEVSKWNKTAKKSRINEKKIPEEVNTINSLEVIQENSKKKLLNSNAEIRSEESFADKQLNNLNSSKFLSEKKKEIFDTSNATEFNLLMKNKRDQKIKEEALKTSVEIRKPKFFKEVGNIEFNANSEKQKNISLEISSPNLDSTTDNSVIKNPDTKGETFFSKTNSTEKKFLTRLARDTRNLSDYEEPEKLEFDYNFDSLDGIQPVTKNMTKREEDNAEGLRGTSTVNNYSSGVNFLHSVIHEIFLKDKKPTEEEIPDLHQHLQSFPASNVEFSNALNFPIEHSDNLTNYIDSSELLTLVKGLEEFLFDDSITGTSDRKQLLKNQDLDAESSNRNFETRYAIFKTKKLSVNKKNDIKNGKKVDRTKNWEKTKLKESSKKKTSNLSSSGKYIQPKTNRKMRKSITDEKNEKRKKEKKISFKTKKSTNFKTKSTSKIRRPIEKESNSTKSLSANKWKNHKG